jgi:hypothetical protein
MTDDAWIDQPRIDVRKVPAFATLASGFCGGCGRPIVYNLVIQEPNPDCPRPWVKVERTPEEEARIAAAEAEHAATDKALRARHAWLLEHAPHPILRALIEAHRPASDGEFPACAECPEIPNEYGDSDPESWPCRVWTFHLGPDGDAMTVFDQVLEITGGKTAEENPGHRLRLNSEHLEQLASESPWDLPFLALHSDLTAIRVYGYPIVLDESASEMRLESV